MPIGFLLHRINVKLYGISKETSEAFKNAAGQVRIVFLVEYLKEVVDPHGDSNHLLCVLPEILAQPIKFEVIRNKREVSSCT